MLLMKAVDTRETSTGLSPAALVVTLNVDDQDLLVSKNNITCALAANIEFHFVFERNVAQAT